MLVFRQGLKQYLLLLDKGSCQNLGLAALKKVLVGP